MTNRRFGGLVATVEGSGPPLLFLHGIGSSRHGFGPQVARFRDRFTCICPDAPGYGDSDDVDDVGGMDGYAARYEALLESFGSPAFIVGVSFGGVVAARMAMRAKIDMAALVLADTSRGSGVDADKAAAMRARPDELALVGPTAFAATRAPRLVSTSAAPALVDSVAAAMASTIRLPGYANAAAAMADTDHSERLAQIDCPTLVVVGEHDQVCPYSEAETIAASVPGASLAVVAGAGHLSYLERPDGFSDVIEPFLDAHRPDLCPPSY